MTDIVERLRQAVDPFWSHTRDEVIAEAAAEIERLRADNDTLRQMLKTLTQADPRHDLAAEVERLRAALQGVLAREMEWAGHQGLSDCRCINLSRGAEREYERGECPHQKARRELEGK